MAQQSKVLVAPAEEWSLVPSIHISDSKPPGMAAPEALETHSGTHRHIHIHIREHAHTCACAPTGTHE